MKIVTFNVNQDWQADTWPEPGSIFEYLGKEYEKDKKLTLCVFKQIGKPVEEKGSIKVEFI